MEEEEAESVKAVLLLGHSEKEAGPDIRSSDCGGGALRFWQDCSSTGAFREKPAHGRMGIR